VYQFGTPLFLNRKPLNIHKMAVTKEQFLAGGTFTGTSQYNRKSTLTLTKTERESIYKVHYEFNDDAHRFMKVVSSRGQKIRYIATNYVDNSVITDMDNVPFNDAPPAVLDLETVTAVE
jgi:hypothetical protein